MSVDDDLPWDEEPEAPSWYAVEDETRWDPDDDGGLPDLGTVESDLESTAAVVIVRFGPTESDGVETPTHDTAEGAETVDVDDPDNGPPRRFGPADAPRRPAGLFGLAAGALSDATKFLAGAVSGGRLPDHPELTRVADTVVGVGNGMTTVLTTVAGTAGRLARPAVDLAMHPPLVPQRWHPATVLGQFESAGRASRRLGERDAVSLLDQLLPAIVDAVLDRIDLTQIVLDRVDLARVIDAVDLNAVVARVDIASIIDRVDIDAVLAQVDLDAVMARVDLDKIIARVDIDSIINGLDLDAIVAAIDLNKIISTVDVNAVVSTVDIDAIIARVDVAGIAEDVIVEVNLPRIIRESSSSIATETMIGVRMGSASADQGVGRILERLRLRRRADPGNPDPTMLQVPVPKPPPGQRERPGASTHDALTTGAEPTGSSSREATPGPAPEPGIVSSGAADPVVDFPITASPPNGGVS
jgi:hypothetical protein